MSNWKLSNTQIDFPVFPAMKSYFKNATPEFQLVILY